MTESDYFNLDYIPESYWPAPLGTKVKGELRRQAAKNLAAESIHDLVISSENLSEEQLTAVGRFHPMFMGGEYLPDQYGNEIEIARVIMQSVTMDVISIRARKTKHRLVYRIVDEYQDEYKLSQKTSVNPLSLSQIISMTDNAQDDGGLVSHARNINYKWSDDGAESLYDFATVSSEFYPELGAWYDRLNQAWLEKNLYEETGMTKAERQEEEYRDNFSKGIRAATKDEKQWRLRNLKVLNEKKKEREEARLHGEYKRRYMSQQQPQSEDEKLWRAILITVKAEDEGGAS